MFVHYEQEITRLHTALAVAGLDEVAKAGPSLEDLKKFTDAEEKEDTESSEASADNELPLVIEEEVREERRETKRDEEREDEIARSVGLTSIVKNVKGQGRRKPAKVVYRHLRYFPLRKYFLSTYLIIYPTFKISPDFKVFVQI